MATQTEAATPPRELHLTPLQREVVVTTQERVKEQRLRLQEREREALQALALILDAHQLPADTEILSFDDKTGVLRVAS